MKYVFTLLLALSFWACQTAKEQPEVAAALPNPAAEGFREEASDEKAIALADKVMEASGGRQAWDQLQYLQWTFFGSRTLLWDKPNERVRIEYPEKEMIIVTSLGDTPTGKVWRGGTEMTEADSLQKYLEMGKSIWINDAYWLCMPFKLKDSGVALNYVREDTTQTGAASEVVSLTFENVGRTPENKYEVWIDKRDYMVTQWAYFSEASQDTANFITPWDDYEPYGKLLLSGDKGMGKLTNIRVLTDIEDGLFDKGSMALPID